MRDSASRVDPYARPDVFRLIVDERPKPPVSPAEEGE